MTCHRLESDTAHVWSVNLTAPGEIVENYASLLSVDELERRRRLIEGPVRERFTLARGILRILLGRYLARDPRSIEFVYGKRGKPALADPRAPLRFNLAHSEDLAVYAFSNDRELGIDIEWLREIPEMEQVARRFFAPEEAGILESLPAGERTRSFYRAWTRKEAYVKAVGDGLHTPLSTFCVTLRPEEPARMVTLNGSALAASVWQVHHLEPADGFLGALAYSGSPLALLTRKTADPARLLRGEV